MSDAPALHVLRGGVGAPTLVFLHYFGGAAASWMPLMRRLEARCRCLAPDLPGFGRSRPIAPASVAAMADQVGHAIRDEAAGEFILLGHSMGGKIALALAARRPVGLAGLVLVAPSPPSPEPIGAEQRREMLAAYGDRKAASETLARITKRTLPDELVRTEIEHHIAASHDAWRWWLEQGSREDLSDLARQIACPTLVVIGGEDPAMPPETVRREVVARIAGAREHVVAGSGHLVPLEAPDELAAAIVAFVDALRLGQPRPR